jgi:hypothetical protein
LSFHAAAPFFVAKCCLHSSGERPRNRLLLPVARGQPAARFGRPALATVTQKLEEDVLRGKRRVAPKSLGLWVESRVSNETDSLNENHFMKELPSDYIFENSHEDTIDRRGFLKCMTWAGTGIIWSVNGGILISTVL